MVGWLVNTETWLEIHVKSRLLQLTSSVNSSPTGCTHWPNS